MPLVTHQAGAGVTKPRNYTFKMQLNIIMLSWSWLALGADCTMNIWTQQHGYCSLSAISRDIMDISTVQSYKEIIYISFIITFGIRLSLGQSFQLWQHQKVIRLSKKSLVRVWFIFLVPVLCRLLLVTVINNIEQHCRTSYFTPEVMLCNTPIYHH